MISVRGWGRGPAARAGPPRTPAPCPPAGNHKGNGGRPEDYITKGLGRYLLNPQVTVAIDEYRNFFVNGMVERPGGYPFSPGLTVRKAITLAGGFKERASRDKINVIRDDDPKQTARRVDLNAPILPGDILTVEESFF